MYRAKSLGKKDKRSGYSLEEECKVKIINTIYARQWQENFLPNQLINEWLMRDEHSHLINRKNMSGKTVCFEISKHIESCVSNVRS